jgi:2-methylcitrate dehydratase PrpD
MGTAASDAFVNTTMIRNLDINDEFPGAHPSICLGALLAITEADEQSGYLWLL